MQKKLSIALVLIAAFGQSLQAAPSTQMHVSVEVIARTVLTIDSQPASVEVTSADVSRGYVDVPAAVTFRVRSNARNGYAVQFQPVRGPFSQAQISWGNATATVATDSSWVAQPYQHGTTAGAMDVRLSLAPGTLPGTYSWPVSVDADSL